MLNSDEGSSFVHHSVASLRALIKSFMEQVSRFFLTKAHCILHMQPVIFCHQQFFSEFVVDWTIAFVSLARLIQWR